VKRRDGAIAEPRKTDPERSGGIAPFRRKDCFPGRRGLPVRDYFISCPAWKVAACRRANGRVTPLSD